MRSHLLIIFISLFIAGCASPDYWMQPGKTLRETASDIHGCRVSSQPGGQQVFSARELEFPCMIAKGYNIGKTPPKE